MECYKNVCKHKSQYLERSRYKKITKEHFYLSTDVEVSRLFQLCAKLTISTHVPIILQLLKSSSIFIRRLYICNSYKFSLEIPIMLKNMLCLDGTH